MIAARRCRFCGEPLLRESETALLVEGWIEWRRGGGAHGVRLASAPRAWAHQVCLDSEVERERRGGQQALL